MNEIEQIREEVAEMKEETGKTESTNLIKIKREDLIELQETLRNSISNLKRAQVHVEYILILDKMSTYNES